jgi:hypothetical protein
MHISEPTDKNQEPQFWQESRMPGLSEAEHSIVLGLIVEAGESLIYMLDTRVDEYGLTLYRNGYSSDKYNEEFLNIMGESLPLAGLPSRQIGDIFEHYMLSCYGFK